MNIYISNFWLAVMFFTILFIFSIIPFVYWNYKKYGHIGRARTIGIYLLIFSFFVAFFMVVFPLPEITENFCAKRVGKLAPSFELFRFVREIIEELNGKISLTGILKSKTFMVTVFNVFLLLPVGFLLKYLFKLEWWKVLIIGFSTSLFFEITQLTGNFGIYPCAYRLFEVDDLMTNTAGVMFGYWLFKYFRFLPDSKIEKIEIKKDANLTQRFLVLVLDYLFISFIAENFIIPDDINILSHLIWTLLIFFIYFVIIPQTKIKTTLAGKIFGLKLLKEDNKNAGLKSLIVFYGILIFIPVIISNVSKYLVVTEPNNGIYAIVGFMLLFIWMIVTFGFVFFRKDNKGLHNILSELKLVNSN